MIGLTGVTGEIGSKVLNSLSSLNVDLCLLLRNAEKINKPNLVNTQLRPFDFTNIDKNTFQTKSSFL